MMTRSSNYLSQESGKQHSKRIVFVAFLFVTSFFFHQYSSVIPGVTLGELFLIIGTVAIFTKNASIIRYTNTNYIVYIYLASLLFSIIAVLITGMSFPIESSTEILTRWVRYFAYTFFYVAYCDNYTGKSYVLKIYRYMCIAVAIYTITQFIVYLLFKYYLPFDIFPFLPRARSRSSEYLLNMSTQYSYRGYGLFDEPAYLAEFLIPGAIFSYSDAERKKMDLFGLVVMSVAILLSTSVQGIVLLATAFTILMVGYKKTNKHGASKVLLIIIALVLVFVFFRSDVFQNALSRITRIGKEASGDYSAKIRLYRGFAVWGQLPIHLQLIGVGMGNAANYCEANNVVTVFDFYLRTASTLEYMNGISRILVENGLICLMLFLGSIAKWFHHSNIQTKALIVVYLLLMLSGSGLFTTEGVLYVFFIISSMKFDVEREVSL